MPACDELYNIAPWIGYENATPTYPGKLLNGIFNASSRQKGAQVVLFPVVYRQSKVMEGRCGTTFYGSALRKMLSLNGLHIEEGKDAGMATMPLRDFKERDA